MNAATLLFALMPVQHIDWEYVTTDPMGMDADGANLFDQDPFGFDSVNVDLFDLDPFSEDPLGIVPWGEDPTYYYSQVDPIHSSDPLGNLGVPNYGWNLGNTTGGLAASFGGFGAGVTGESVGFASGGFGMELGLGPTPGFGGGFESSRLGRGLAGAGTATDTGRDGEALYGPGAASILEYSRLLLSRGNTAEPAAAEAPRPMLQRARAQSVMDRMLSPVTRRRSERTPPAAGPPTPAAEPTTPAPGTPAARVHEWFGTLDANHDGHIDEAEFRTGTLLSAQVYRRVDADGNDQVDAGELESFLLKR